MFRPRFALTAFAVLATAALSADVSLAQAGGGFNKTGRGPRPATGHQHRPQQSPPRGHKGYHRGGYGHQRKQPQFNHHSFYSSRSVTGTGHRYSPGHFRGHYVPWVPFGFYDPYAFGYGPVYPDPYGFGYGYYSFSNQNFNPAYATYGSVLNSGGVLNSNVVGSSVAAQAMERLRNQQPIVPNRGGNDIRDAEILRLQIELERAKQALANQNPQQQKVMKAPVADPAQPDAKEVIEQLGLAPIIETNQLAAASQLKAERAFRAGNYGQAARFAGLSGSLDESNGKLMLFVSQAHFANGEYPEAVEAVDKASTLVGADELGWVAQNFKLFYGKNDYVTHMKRLSGHLEQSPKDGNAFLLRGYHYGALGYPKAATKDLEKAKRLGENSDLLKLLSQRYAVKHRGTEIAE